MERLKDTLPVGKVPAKLLERLLADAPVEDSRVILGPGVGLDCAVVDNGKSLLVFKSDPITFTTDEIGNYLVHINANDIATTGALPRWLLVTLLLPESKSTESLVRTITEQIYLACRRMNVSVIGGHTEVTSGLDRPIAMGSMIGEVKPDKLVTPRGVRPGDRVLLTKGVPIEGTAILANDFRRTLSKELTAAELTQARHFLTEPGISVLEDARIATKAGKVTAMHDPTEGGLASALWELAQASGCSFWVDPDAVPIPPVSKRICTLLGLDPLATIGSGALLITASKRDSRIICDTLVEEGITCAEIGEAGSGPVGVWFKKEGYMEEMRLPPRDEIARLFEG